MTLVDTIQQAERPASLLARAVRSRHTKRAMDVLVGIPLCLVAIPVIGVLAIVLALQLRANPFFVHQRIGHQGRMLAIPKLRTLAPDTHPYADKTVHELKPPTKLAQALRKLHLDELPQLFLVPLGHLSLVGPRPRMSAEADDHGDERFSTVRTTVRQGCTGLWQISEGKVGRVSDHPLYDHFYVEQQTVLLDAWILWRTLRQTLGGQPISVADIPQWALRHREQSLGDSPA